MVFYGERNEPKHRLSELNLELNKLSTFGQTPEVTHRNDRVVSRLLISVA
jgi:hypothetical protein